MTWCHGVTDRNTSKDISSTLITPHVFKQSLTVCSLSSWSWSLSVERFIRDVVQQSQTAARTFVLADKDPLQFKKQKCGGKPSVTSAHSQANDS